MIVFIKLYITLLSLSLVSNCHVFYFKKTPTCLDTQYLSKWNRSFNYMNKRIFPIISVSDSPTHWIISIIFEILARERLGYQKIYYNYWQGGNVDNSTLRLTCPDKECHQMPEAHIDLGVWVPPGAKKIHSPTLTNLGPLGPIIEYGLFASEAYLDHVYKEHNVHLNYWRNHDQLAKANISIPIHLFESISDTKKFIPLWDTQCITRVNCILILTNEQQAVQYLSQQLKLLMNHSAEKPLVMDIRRTSFDIIYDLVQNMNIDSSFFILTPFPNKATVKSSLSRIFVHMDPSALLNDVQHDPTNKLYCRNCDTYQAMHQLNKFIWSELNRATPLLANLASLVRMSTLDYIDFLKSIDHESMIKRESNNTILLLGKSLKSEKESKITLPNIDAMRKIACDWIHHNVDDWTRWTEGYDKKQVLTIPVLLPSFGKWKTQNLLKSANNSLSKFNKIDSSSEYEFKIQSFESECDDSKALEDYMEAVNVEDGKIVVAVIAALCSDSIASIATMSNLTRRIVISPTVESYKHKFTYFFRVVPSITGINFALIHFLKSHGWQRIGILRKDDYFIKASVFRTLDIEVVHDAEMPENSVNYELIYSRLEEMKAMDTKIFIIEFFTEKTAIAMCAALHLGMTIENGYVFFLNPWLPSNWFLDPEIAPPKCATQNLSLSVASSGVFYIAHRQTFVQTEFSVETANTLASPYEIYMEDSVDIILNTFLFLLKEYPSAVSDITDKRVSDKFRELIRENSRGIKFNEANQRIGTNWDIRQAMITSNASHAEPVVFSYTVTNKVNLPIDPDSLSTIELQNAYQEFSDDLQVKALSNFYWGKNNKLKPNDGSVRYLCILGPLAEYLNMDCNTTITIVTIASMLVPLIMLIFFFIWYYRRKAEIVQKSIRKPFEDLCHELAHLEILQSDIVLNRRVGSGAFGLVFGGEAKSNGRWEGVAVKRMSNKSTYEGKIDFLSEAKLMNRLKHKNVVQLIGVGLKGDHLYIVMELLLHGDLKTFLLSRRCLLQKDIQNEIISPRRLTMMAKDIACGVQYLHSFHLIHRDIACRNCLVGEDYTVKIGDFGLTREATTSSPDGYYRFTRSCQLPIRWMSPEAIQLGVFSVKSDLWSYGILLYEIITFGVFPYSPLCDVEVVEKVKRMEFCITEFLPPEAKDTPIWRLIVQLCQYHWLHRPESMQDVIDLMTENPEIVQPFLTEEPPKTNDEERYFGSQISLRDPDNRSFSAENENQDDPFDNYAIKKDSNRPSFYHQLSEPFFKRESNGFDRKNSAKSCLDQYSPLLRNGNLDEGPYHTKHCSTCCLVTNQTSAPILNKSHSQAKLVNKKRANNPACHVTLDDKEPYMAVTSSTSMNPEISLNLMRMAKHCLTSQSIDNLHHSCGNLSSCQHGQNRAPDRANARQTAGDALLKSPNIFGNATNAIKSFLGVRTIQEPGPEERTHEKSKKALPPSGNRLSGQSYSSNTSKQPLLMQTTQGGQMKPCSKSSTLTTINSPSHQTSSSLPYQTSSQHDNASKSTELDESPDKTSREYSEYYTQPFDNNFTFEPRCDEENILFFHQNKPTDHETLP